MKFDSLLMDYQSLWNNRNPGKLKENSEEILYELIRRDIKDENTHPRVRRTPFQKFYWAVKRIQTSNFPSDRKMELINLHLELMEEIKSS